jgi:two-component system, cell cycle sensor histidine kinase and response regulator CckA
MSALSHASAAVSPVPGCFPILTQVKRFVILLVEDEGFVREMAAGILESAGHRVFRASNATEAMKIFERYRKIIDLLVTDIVLPGKNGQYIAEEMRVLSPGLKVVFISGYAEKLISRGCPRTIGDIYLSKPFSAHSFLEKIERLVRS